MQREAPDMDIETRLLTFRYRGVLRRGRGIGRAPPVVGRAEPAGRPHMYLLFQVLCSLSFMRQLFRRILLKNLENQPSSLRSAAAPH